MVSWGPICSCCRYYPAVHGGVGTLVAGRYLLSEAVGQGGMGRVWRGYDQLLNRVVAVKEVVLPPQSPGEHAEMVARMMREAQAAARLDHPGVVTIHDVVEHENSPWIVMQFVAGTSLGSRIGRERRLPWPEVADIGRQIAEALGAAHAAGIVHRDLKPDNILLSGRRAIVTDFGIARIVDATTQLTGTGVRVGTPVYMAPENLDGGGVGPAADLWALGATLYAAVEGTPPFSGATMTALITAILTKPPAAPEYAGPLLEVLGALLAKDPAQRPDAEATARALAACLAGQRGTYPAVSLRSSPMGLGSASVPAYLPTEAVEAHLASTGHPSFPGLRPPHSTQGIRRLRRWPGTRPVAVVVAAAAAAAVLGTLLALHNDRSQPPGTPSAAGTAAGQRPGASTPVGPASPGQSPGAAATTPTPLTSATASPIETLTNPNMQGSVPAPVASVAFGPDGIIAVADGDGNMSLWKITTKAIIGSHPGITFLNGAGQELVEAGGVAFGPNGTLGIANGSLDLWSTSANNVTTVLGTNDDNYDDLAFGPEDTLAVSNDGSTDLWNTVSGTRAASLNDPTSDGYGDATSVAFGPGGLLATGDGDGTTYLWNTTTDSVTGTLTGPSSQGVTSVAFAPDGTLATGDLGGSTYLWNTATGNLIATLSDPGGQSVASVAFGPDGILATGDANGSTYLWNTATKTVIATIPDPDSKGVASVAFAADGTLATGDANGSTYLWRIS
jgi:serine/threonine protein kinase